MHVIYVITNKHLCIKYTRNRMLTFYKYMYTYNLSYMTGKLTIYVNIIT